LPQPAGLVHELLELDRRRTEPRRCPEREGVGPGEVLKRGLGDRRDRIGVLPPLWVLVDCVVGRELGDPQQPHLGPPEAAPSATASASACTVPVEL
jgi:hypothetical protein